MAEREDRKPVQMTGRTTTPALAGGSNALGKLTAGQYTTGGVVGNVYLGGGIFGVQTAPVFNANQYYLSNPAVENYWNGVLKKYGLTPTSPLAGQQMWAMAVQGASDMWAASGGQRAITPEQYVAWWAQSKKPAGKAKAQPTRQVFLSDPATVRELIDTTVSSVLGRSATKDEMDDFYGAINKMMQEGTVTTTQTKVRNGVPETVVTQKQGFSQARAEEMIEKRLKAQSPQDYAEKKSLDFLDFLFGGGQ